MHDHIRAEREWPLNDGDQVLSQTRRAPADARSRQRPRCRSA
jgi:hypothetical protein